MPVRTADAQWEGNLKDGKGTMRLGGGAYEGPYTFSSRFEEGSGTNPEELIAGAHAGCFSMKFSADLDAAGATPHSVHTTANVHLDKVEGGFKITRIHLVSEAQVDGIDEAKFQEVAESSRQNCPISGLVTGAEITVEAKLVG